MHWDLPVRKGKRLESSRSKHTIGINGTSFHGQIQDLGFGGRRIEERLVSNQ